MLGLEGEPQSVTVNVLNGETAQFTSTVTVRLRSIDGTVDEDINAQTADHVTGSLSIIDWNQHANKWNHLRGLNFPTLNNKRPVELIIGIDNSKFHSSKAELVGGNGEPVARLTSLGWTCIGNPTHARELRQNAACQQSSFLVIKEGEESLDQLVKRLWETEQGPVKCTTDLLTLEEQEIIREVENSR